MIKNFFKKLWSKETVIFLIGAICSAAGVILSDTTKETIACLLKASGCE